ncbi:MAG: lytic transglycosylase domain-containing protein [Nevskiales bacterium]
MRRRGVVTLLCGLGLLIAGSSSFAADDGIVHVYRDPSGTRLFSDRKGFSADYVYIGKYGRPTAVLSCQGLTPAKLDARGQRYQAMIDEYARVYDVDAALVKAVMRVESCFDLKARSKVGARGLMQLMPATAAELGVSDSFNADQNIRGGVQYLSMMLKRFNSNLKLALAAYNAGPGAVERHRGIPPFRETQAYVKRVMTHYKQYTASL